ncbi:MAG: ATP-binding cassette domain-containing protein [Planctomycetota bacterium]|nr:MAG: ATP-binding cassette domain-containing protein [Planctomycetota bacterium]
MPGSSAIAVAHLAHRYGETQALRGVSFDVAEGAIFGLLGPNGSGKTTLFRILATLLPLQQGEATVLGNSVASAPDAVRRLIGVTFQSPSLDVKLTVGENLKFHGYLYGLSGSQLQSRCSALLDALGLADRDNDNAGELSGGLQRRVEIAKSLLHEPRVLLLDEPSTGLDPGARHDLWRYLRQLRESSGVTILVTTHLMEEAERCDRLAILNHGELVGIGSPDELRASVGGDCITIQTDNLEGLAGRIREKFQLQPQKLGDALRIEMENGHEFVRDLMEADSGDVRSISLGKPTLEDVFIHKTGHRFWDENEAEES